MRGFQQAAVHGRFQILHNGHLEYLRGAKSRCRFLWVGITQLNSHDLQASPEDPHRQEGIHNPMTYFERVDMITHVLLDEGLSRDEFDTLPFPIETPQHLDEFLPTNIPIFTTIYDDWNRHKVRLLQASGYEVVVLWERQQKVFDGARIREMILRDDTDWVAQVPSATLRTVEKYRIEERIRKLGRK